MIQVELAGPRLPPTFEFVPNEIRSMAQEVLSECAHGKHYEGGFVASDMQVIRNWIFAEETRLDNPFRESPMVLVCSGQGLTLTSAYSTAFLTVTIGHFVPTWQSPGNYDPVIAYTLAASAEAAAKRAYTPSLMADLHRREERFLKQGEAMEPRGAHRDPWWQRPPGIVGQEFGTSGESNRAVS